MGETNFAKVDVYVNTAADYDEIPDISDADPALATWKIAGVPVTEAEARMPAVGGGKMQVALCVGRDVVDLFKVDGPGWHGRMNAALRKAVGLG